MVKEESRPGRKLIYWDFLRILNGEEGHRGCPALRDTLLIEPDGNMSPCLNSSEFPLGNIITDEISEKWFTKDARAINDKIRQEKCKTCMFACGASYVDGLRYYLWDAWLRTDLSA